VARRLILHIGANKTGSSAVQSLIRLNLRAFRSLGYAIPDRFMGLSRRITGEQVFGFEPEFEREDAAAIGQKIAYLMARTSQPNLLISAENLSNPDNFRFFRDCLKSIECRVILYVRRQDEFLLSSWRQWHSKTETDLHAWLLRAVPRLGHWLPCIEGWESVVGEGNVTVRIFQRSDLVNGDVVDDFASVMGLDIAALNLTRPAAPVNASHADLVTEMVCGNAFLFADQHDSKFYEFVQKMTGDHFMRAPQISLISARQRDSLIAFYAAENDAVCRKYLTGRARLFEPVDHSKYEYLSRDELVRRQLGFLASLVYGMYQSGP